MSRPRWALVSAALLATSLVAAQTLSTAQQHFQQGYALHMGEGDEGDGGPDLKQAVRYYSEALKLDPNFFEAHANAGRAHFELGDYRRAKFHLSEAIKLARNRDEISEVVEAQLSSDIGGCFFKQGSLKEAERWFRGAIRLAPDEVEGHFNLINLLISADRIEEGRQHLSVAREMAPSSTYNILDGRITGNESQSWTAHPRVIMVATIAISIGGAALIYLLRSTRRNSSGKQRSS